MRLIGIFIAKDTAKRIAEIAKQQISRRKSSKSDDTVPLQVRDPNKKEEQTFDVIFTGLRKNGFLHGHTSDGVHIFIKLGTPTERETRYPSVVVSAKETTTSIAQRPMGPPNGNSKRR